MAKQRLQAFQDQRQAVSNDLNVESQRLLQEMELKRGIGKDILLEEPVRTVPSRPPHD